MNTPILSYISSFVTHLYSDIITGFISVILPDFEFIHKITPVIFDYFSISENNPEASVNTLPTEAPGFKIRNTIFSGQFIMHDRLVSCGCFRKNDLSFMTDRSLTIEASGKQGRNDQFSPITMISSRSENCTFVWPCGFSLTVKLPSSSNFL